MYLPSVYPFISSVSGYEEIGTYKSIIESSGKKKKMPEVHKPRRKVSMSCYFHLLNENHCNVDYLCTKA